MPPPPLPPSDYTVVVGTLIFTIVWVFITKAKVRAMRQFEHENV